MTTTQISPEIQMMLDKTIPATQIAGFSCKGCGALCCVNKDIILNPPEFLRIQWYLQREMTGNIDPAQWAQMHIGHSSGLPVLTIRNIAVSQQISVCPFLKKIPLGHHPLAACTIHESRPLVCRIYPFGRVKYLQEHETHQKGNVDYMVFGRCPGFSPPQPEETIMIGYTPIDQCQTVEEWVSEQMPPDLRSELDYWQDKLLPMLFDKGLRAAGVGGILSEEEVFSLGRILYPFMKAPDDPADDHRVIGLFLRSVADFTDQMVGIAEGERNRNEPWMI